MNSTPTTWPHDVFNLAKTNGSLNGQLPIELLTRLHSDLTQTTGALNYQISGATNAQKHALINVRAQGLLHMTCQRCLEALQYTVDVDNILHMVADEGELDSEEDELNAIIAGTASPEKMVGAVDFDILALLEDEIILSLPHTLAHEVCPTQLPSSFGEKVSPFDVLNQLK